MTSGRKPVMNRHYSFWVMAVFYSGKNLISVRIDMKTVTKKIADAIIQNEKDGGESFIVVPFTRSKRKARELADKLEDFFPIYFDLDTETGNLEIFVDGSGPGPRNEKERKEMHAWRDGQTDSLRDLLQKEEFCLRYAKDMKFVCHIPAKIV